jgi:hypothetical protein
MHRSDAAVTKTAIAFGHLIMDVVGREHRLVAGTPLAWPESFLDSAIASVEFLL